MVSEIRIYFEGDRSLRLGLEAFLNPALERAREQNIRFTAIASGPIDETIKDFLDAVRDYPDALVILLVDSDRADNGRLIASIKSRSTWNARIGAGVQDNQIHFMVQVMESWFLADKDALANYYGRGFRLNRLPQNPNVEQVPGNDVIRGIASAASDTSKKTYHKTRHAPDLLRTIDPAKVRSAAPNCDNLFDALQRLT